MPNDLRNQPQRQNMDYVIYETAKDKNNPQVRAMWSWPVL